jgi:hypothetical protein
MSDDENVLKLVVEDKSYISEHPTDEQRYLVSQIQELQNQRNQCARALDQTTASLQFFTQKLISGLEEEKQEDSLEVG